MNDKLYVFTMTNTAYLFDVNTGAQLVARQLAPPFDPRPDPGQMDRWLIYHNWGITATPVIDVATNTIYVTTFGKPRAQCAEHRAQQSALDPRCNHARQQTGARAHRGQCG